MSEENGKAIEVNVGVLPGKVVCRFDPQGVELQMEPEAADAVAQRLTEAARRARNQLRDQEKGL